MKNLTKHLQNSNARESMWQREDTIVIGVSGGKDSMCLLDILSRIAKKESLTLVVAHVNYGLRGADSQRDQEFVEATSLSYGLTCEVLCAENDASTGSEAQWRKTRYVFFDRMAKKYHASSIAVAHTKNDHAETFLLHLLRGTDLNGLANMTFRSEKAPFPIIRPLLDTTTDDILSHNASCSVMFHEDITNTDTQFARNKIRTQLLPILAKDYNPQIVSALTSTAHRLHDEREGHPVQTPIWEQALVGGHDACQFQREAFLALSPAAQRHALHEMTSSVSSTDTRPSFASVESWRQAIASDKSKVQKMSVGDLILEAKGATVSIMSQD